MIDFERALLTKIVSERTVQDVLKAKVTEKFFFDGTNRALFKWLLVQYRKHGKVPTMGVVRSEFSDFLPQKTANEFPILIDRVRDKKIYVDLQKSVKEIVDASVNPREGLEKLRARAVALSREHSEIEDIEATGDSAAPVRAYEKAKRNKGLLGIPWPWPALTKVTKGLRKDDFVNFYGSAGSFKSWLLIYLSLFFHRDAGKKVVFFTYEMPREGIQLRHAALAAGVNWEKFQEGKLSDKEEVKFYDIMDELESYDPFHIVELESEGPAAILDIQAKIEEYDADVALLDGLSLAIDDFDWKPFGQFCKGLRMMNKRMRIPLITSHHANRDRKKHTKSSNDAMDVALGDTLHRYVTLLGRVVCELKQEEEEEVIITLRKVREGKRCTFAVNARPAYPFDEKYVQKEHDSLEDLGVDGGIV